MKNAIMKTKMKQALRGLFCAALAAAFAACDADPLVSNGGKLPDPGALDNTSVVLRSARSAGRNAAILLTEGSTQASDRIYCHLTRPAGAAAAFTAAADPSLVEAYNAEHGTRLKPLPAANVALADGGALTVAAGGRSSQRLSVTFSSDGLAPGKYLLPVAIASDDAGKTDGNRVIYYGVIVRDREELLYYEEQDTRLPLDIEFLTVFYLNTTEYQPLLADKMVVEMYGMSFEPEWRRTFGNIVNLRTTTLDYDRATGRAVFSLTPDMRYVLEHADKYIRPLQDKGRKVCLSIEGAGTGLGFCNLTNTQIADFTAQVEAVVELYALDGINLFDRNSNYGAEGMPAMNTTSYPKLVKALREAMPSKMLTLADYEAPTEYFHDTGLTGGIAVGDYIDYAWSGYMSEDEDVQLLDPWHTMTDPEPFEMWGSSLPTSIYNRKPIAGLTPERFGHFAVPFYPKSMSSPNSQYWYGTGMNNVGIWASLGLNPNRIMVFADLISNNQDEYEGSWVMPLDIVQNIGDFEWINFYAGGYTGLPNAYGWMLKDW